MPFPTVALVDAEGTLRWIDVQPNYAKRTEPKQILDAVEKFVHNLKSVNSTYPPK